MLIAITWNDIITSLITGISSSFVFLFLLWNLKPKFRISPKICHEKIIYNGADIDIYLFKVMNRSYLFKVYDVRVLAAIVTPQKNLNGVNNILSALKIEFSKTSMIPTFNMRHCFQTFFNGDNTLKYRTDYAVKFFTLTDCKAILNNNEKQIEFQIVAKHSLTGFTIVKTMRYAHVSKIEEGAFLSGNSFKIVPQLNRLVITNN